MELTIYDLVNKAINTLDNIGYANAEEVKKFAAPIIESSNLLKTCVQAWDEEAMEQKQEHESEQESVSEQEQDIETVESGIDGGVEDGQETNT